MKLCFLLFFSLPVFAAQPALSPRSTVVSIVGEDFLINGRPTYAGRNWQGHKIEGLLLNTRMVQALFDDCNTNTVQRWAYPDTGKWDAERNTREFVAAMPAWRRCGLLAITINLQGGMPVSGANSQPWDNSAFEADGALRADYLARLDRVLDRADDLGMVVILGCFYFGQDERLRDEAAVLRAIDGITGWLLDHAWGNVMIEVNNECDMSYDHAILTPARVHELIGRVKSVTRGGRRLLAGTSYSGGAMPGENVVRASDFLLLHGNSISDPKRIADMVQRTRRMPGYTPKPILFNEDDHYEFDQPENNFTAAIAEHASWGYYDQGTNNYADGYQSPPANWGIQTHRKDGFFRLAGEISGTTGNRAR
ncbi:MAG TPA: hypothetical protein VFD66_12325 [Verrucomicrobiae bacterium]|nr:hypothetical protein [Verrucomicrobiae bacterium]